MGDNWEQRGANAVNAGADLATGIFSAVRGIGGRLKRSKHEKFIDAFCAMTGSMAAQNGRLLPEEIQAFKNFLLQNRANPVFAHFEVDELVSRLEKFAVAEFLCKGEEITRAIDGIDVGGDSAKMALLGALAVAFADGDCDAREAMKINEYSAQLGLSLSALSSEFQIQIPQLPAQSNDPAEFARVSAPDVVFEEPPVAPVAPAIPQQTVRPVQQAVVTPTPPAQPQGKPCRACNGTGQRQGKTCVFCKGKCVK
ncbi:TerB family tellurite resistance protein [Patescibacteria group bacterium]